MAELYRDKRTFFGVEDDIWIALALWSILSYTGIVGSINKIVNLVVGTPISWDTAAVALVLGVFIVLGTMTAIKRMERKTFLLMVIVAFCWIFSFLINENARMVLKMYYFVPVMVTGICGIVCIGNFRNWAKFQQVGMVFVTVGLILFLINGINIINRKVEESYMPISYNNLVFIIGAFWLAIHRKNILMWVFAMAGTLFMITVGCRGVVLCIAVYVLLEFLFNNKIHITAKIAFFIAVVVAFINLENVMTWINNIMKELGYESRTIEMFFKGVIIENDSGRSIFRKGAWEVVENFMLFGCGMGGSSYYLYEAVHGMPPVGLDRAYSHNLFLDILMDFGLVFGGLICALIVFGIISAYLKSRKMNLYGVLFLMFAITIPKMFLSSTYLAEAPFFILLGLLINLNSASDRQDELDEVIYNDI